MSTKAQDTQEVTLDSLSEAQVNALMAQITAKQEADKEAATAHLTAQKALLQTAVLQIAATPERQFQPPKDSKPGTLGARGWQVPVKVTVPGHGEVVGSLLVRIASTIPKKA